MYWPALTGNLLQACKKCKVKTNCVDEGGSCPKWARSGYCYSSQYKKYMKLKCKKSCKLCWIIYLYIFEDKGLNLSQDGPQGFIWINFGWLSIKLIENTKIEDDCLCRLDPYTGSCFWKHFLLQQIKNWSLAIGGLRFLPNCRQNMFSVQRSSLMRCRWA